MLAGAWLLAAPFVLGYSAFPRAFWNDIVVGAIVLILALVRLFTPRRSPVLSWINVLLGAWLIIAPFVLLYDAASPAAAGATVVNTGAATANDIIVGIIVLVLGAASARAAHADAAGRGATLGRTSASTAERGGPNV